MASSSAASAPPHQSSTLVNVSENATTVLVHLLRPDSPTFLTACETCIGNADAAGLLRTILGDGEAVAGLLRVEPPDEAVGAFALLASLLERIADGEGGGGTAKVLASEMADAIASGRGENVSQKKMAMLSTLYNLRTDGTEKCALLTRIVSLAAKSDPVGCLDVNSALGGYVGDAVGVHNMMVNEWGVTDGTAQRKLYRAIIEGLGEDSRRQTFLLLLLETYNDASEVDANALASAKGAAVGAIKDPVTLFAEQRGMLLLPAVSALGNDAATKSLFKLLQIFQEGRLQDFETYAATKDGSKTLTEFDLSRDGCIENMRLLSLCSLASEHTEIPYSEIASTLQVDDADVENWVIAAVSSGLLAAKMDQLQRVVMVERCVVRAFGSEQWKALQGRLNGWKENVRGVLEGIEKSQQSLAGQ